MTGSGATHPSIAGEQTHLAGETTTNTADGSQSVHDLLTTVNVGVEHTNDVLEVVVDHKRLHRVRMSGRGNE